MSIASIVAAAATSLVVMSGVQGCTNSERRSGFDEKTESTEPDGGGGGNNGLGKPSEEKDGGCASTQTTIERVPVIIEFVVDESGSMAAIGKWEAQRDALLAAFAEMQNTADPSTFVGMLLFDTTVNDKVNPDTLANASHYDDLVSAIDKSEPGGGSTYTLAALKSAFTSSRSSRRPQAFRRTRRIARSFF